MDGEAIWDYPKDFEVKNMNYAHWANDNGINDLVREYMDTPFDELLHKKFESETKYYDTTYCGCPSVTINHNLTDIFKAADRRLGKKNLLAWGEELKNPVVGYILSKRFKVMIPYLTFELRAKICMDMLSKQEPVTLEYARAQTLKIRGDFATIEEALKFVNTLTNDEYINYVQGGNLK
jgi:hypothetical protein